MEKILHYLLWSVVSVVWIRHLSYIEVLGLCFCFDILRRAAKDIIQYFKLDEIKTLKKISAHNFWGLLFNLSPFLIFCICKWTGII